MRKLSLLAFLALLLGATSYIIATPPELPVNVASHSNGAGANGWMGRELYLWFMLGLAALLPLAIVALLTGLPRLVVRQSGFSRRLTADQQKKRDAATAALPVLAPWLGALLTAFIAGVHGTILEANRSVPAQLPMDLFLTLMIAFLVALAVWLHALARQVRAAL